MRKRPSKLVIGIGNPLRRDDGIGIEAAARLARCQLPPDVEIFDGGTAGLDLATVIEDRELVIIVDGVELDEAPGTIYELDTEELRPGSDSGLSVHDFHLLHALDETRLLGRAPKRTIVIAMQVGDLSAGIGLTPPLQAAMPRLIAAVAHHLNLDIHQLRDSAATACDHPVDPTAALSTEVPSWH